MSEQLFIPSVNNIHRFSEYVMLLPKSGKGMFQIDFRNYTSASHRAIFLSKGQYFQLLEGDLHYTRMAFPDGLIKTTQDARFLFKHLVSLGSVELSPLESVSGMPLKNGSLCDQPKTLQSSIHKWRVQNPLKSSEAEIRLMFDLKDHIDARFKQQPNMPQLFAGLQESSAKVNHLLKKRLGITAGRMLQNKTLLEAQRALVFTDQSVKEIAYELRFRDPAYFSRFFKQNTGKTPREFRETFEFDERDSFLNDLLAVIDMHFKDERSTAFYADQLGMSSKTLSKKVKQKLHLTVGELVRERVLDQGKILLQQDLPILEIAFELGFEEPNHFSAFFKNYTGKTPTQFRHSISFN